MLKKNLLILFFIPSFLEAQTYLKTGDPSIRYDLMKPSRDIYELFFYDGNGNLKSQMINERIVSIDSTRQVVVVTQFLYRGSARIQIDTTIAEIKTLKPVRMSMHTIPDSRSMDLQFKNNSVFAKSNKSGLQSDTTHHVDEGYFDSNLFEYLIGLLPYESGYNIEINLYTFEQAGNDPQKIKYVGKDYWRQADGSIIPLNIIEVRGVKDNINSLSWVDSRTGAVLKRLINLGSNGTFIEIKE